MVSSTGRASACSTHCNRSVVSPPAPGGKVSATGRAATAATIPSMVTVEASPTASHVLRAYRLLSVSETVPEPSVSISSLRAW